MNNSIKLKFLSGLLIILGLAVGSYADCTKDEILKFLDKNFSKVEIEKICNKNEEKTKELTFITPSHQICVDNGGKMNSDGCSANWENAKSICNKSNARLISSEELKQVLIDCGAIINEYDKNVANFSYRSCHKKKGFESNYYWSNLGLINHNNDSATNVNFGGAMIGTSKRSSNLFVRCVED